MILLNLGSLGLRFCINFAEFFFDTPCFHKGDENFVQLFLPLCDQTDHWVRITIRSALVEQG